MDKLDQAEQYGHRQNLEIVGVPVQENEDTNALVIEVGKLLDVEVPPDQISTSHRLPINPNSKISKTPPIIQGVPEYMTQFQNFIKNKQVKIQQKLKYFLKGYEMPFQFSSLLQVILKIVSLKWRLIMSMQF